MDRVNNFRSAAGTAKNERDKAALLEQSLLKENIFGDCAFITRRDLLPVLRLGIDAGASSFETWPGFEIWLRLFVRSSSSHIPEPVSNFYLGDHDQKSDALKARIFVLQAAKIVPLLLLDHEFAGIRCHWSDASVMRMLFAHMQLMRPQFRSLPLRVLRRVFKLLRV